MVHYNPSENHIDTLKDIHPYTKLLAHYQPFQTFLQVKHSQDENSP